MTSDRTADDRHPLDLLTEEFVARYRRGENPSVTEYARRHPEYADDIRELLSAATLLENLKGSPLSASAATNTRHPEQLGDFRILREIGRGGMGVVYEAEQLSLGRRVAVKVLPANLHLGGEQLQRFEREARAAGRLHHTNIVPVFGVGEQDGLHYYVMQYIQGHGLDRLIEQHRLRQAPCSVTVVEEAAPVANAAEVTAIYREGESSTSTVPLPVTEDAPVTAALANFTDPRYYRQAAQWMVQVADALAYAHGQGILHRDIKPANLLLDEHGTVWVTDFGLAKSVEQDDLTRPGEMAGTLRYSAPERFQGRSDARSDIHSLGLTLYELLTLRPAYDETDPGRLLRQVMNAQVVSPRQHNRAVPRDLETIVLRALAPEPALRYQTAADLADDLRRFLEDRPVRARRGSVLEHAWRWCRRNPTVATLTLALALALVAGFSGVVWKWREASANLRTATSAEKVARQALAEAQSERSRAEGNLDLALEGFERIAGRLARPGIPLEGDGEEAPAPPIVSAEAAVILQDLVQFYDRFAEGNASDPRLKRDTIRALRRIGAIRLRLGEYAQAAEALRKASALLAETAEQELDRAQVHNDLGVVLRHGGDLARALAEHEKALEVLKGPVGQSSAGRLERARAHHLYGSLQVRQVRPAQAEKSQQAALALLEELAKEDPKNPSYRHTLARVLNDLSLVYWPRRLGDSVQARTRAQEILEKLVKEFPTVPDYRADLAELLISFNPRAFKSEGPPLPLPMMQRLAGDMERRCQQAVELAAELTTRHPAAPEYQALLARARQRLGLAQHMAGKPEGLKNIREALAAHDELCRRFPGVPAYQLPAIEARLALGDALRKTDPAASEAALREAQEQLQKLLNAAPRSPFGRAMLARSYRSLAQTLLKRGKKEEAERASRQADKLTGGKS